METQTSEPRLVAGLPIQETTIDAAVQSVLTESLEGGSSGFAVRFVNAYSLALSERQEEYRKILQGPGVNFPDGAPLAWLMRRLGARDAGQVRGPSFFEMALGAGVPLGVRHYLFGTSPATLDRLQKKIEQAYPGIKLVGLSAPAYGTVTEILHPDNIQPIQDSSPHLVWVALGTPKQDFVAARLSETLDVPCIGVGAAFDFLAGTQPEGPRLMRRVGLEWLFRLATNPRRLGSRYLIGNTLFLGVALKALRKGGAEIKGL